MEVFGLSAPFGQTRTRVLVLLSLLGSSYPRELSRLLDQPLSVVQKALAGLERDAVVAAQTIGRTRLFRLDPRYFAYREMNALLERFADVDKDLKKRAATVRRRPRRTGKPL